MWSALPFSHGSARTLPAGETGLLENPNITNVFVVVVVVVLVFVCLFVFFVFFKMASERKSRQALLRGPEFPKNIYTAFLDCMSFLFIKM